MIIWIVAEQTIGGEVGVIENIRHDIGNVNLGTHQEVEAACQELAKKLAETINKYADDKWSFNISLGDV